MLSIYNKALMKELNAPLLEQMEKLEKEGLGRTRIEKAENGQKALVLTQDNREYYLTSRYNPEYEAKKLVDSYSDLNNESSIIFFGVGLGYHIKEVLRRYPGIKYFLVEPDEEILYRFLEQNELKDMQLKNLNGVETDYKRMEITLAEFGRKFNRQNVLFFLKSYVHFFKEKRQEFYEKYLLTYKKEKDSAIGGLILSKPMIESIMINMKPILTGPNLFWQDLTQFAGKTAILVAAGPSLDEEIENLRIIKAKKMAGIFAVGSAINALLAKDIYPDAVFSYDPTPANQKVLQQIKDRNIIEIPLFYGTEIGYQSLQGYPGKTFSILSVGATQQNYFLIGKKPLPEVGVGRTISVLALDTLRYLGFGRIILVGQNLGIKGSKVYSSGISYIDSDKIGEQYSVEAKDVYGNTMRTASIYVTMKEDIEDLLSLWGPGEVEVYNATQGGIAIKGTRFKELSELMKTMPENDIDFHWDEKAEGEYDRKYMAKRIKEVAADRDILERYIASCKTILKEIEKERKLGHYDRLRKSYVKLNLALKRLEENLFSTLFVMPIKEVGYKNLVDKIEYFNEIQDPAEQAQTIWQEFNRFLTEYEPTYKKLTEDYKQMEAAMQDYVREGEKK